MKNRNLHTIEKNGKGNECTNNARLSIIRLLFTRFSQHQKCNKVAKIILKDIEFPVKSELAQNKSNNNSIINTKSSVENKQNKSKNIVIINNVS